MNDSKIFFYLGKTTPYSCPETFLTVDYNTSNGVIQRGTILSTDTYRFLPVGLKNIDK